MTTRLDRPIRYLAIASVATAVGIARLVGVPRLVLSLIIVAIAFEQYLKIARDRILHHPTTLLSLGWVFPFALTFLPLDRVFFRISLPGPAADMTWWMFIVLFYLFGFFVSGKTPMGSDRVNSRYPLPLVHFPVIALLFILSNIGFIIALASNGFMIPLLQDDVTAAAALFFRLTGTATLFNVGKIALIIGISCLSCHGSHGIGRGFRTVLLLMLVLFLIEQLLYGKRMGLLMSFGSMAIVASIYDRLNWRVIGISVLLVVIVVVGNAYVRAKPYFESGWDREDVSAFDELWQIAAAQPAIYVNETFANLGHLAENGRSTAGSGRVYSFNRISDDLIEGPDDEYSLLRSRGKMTTFLGSAFADGGLPFAAAWAVCTCLIIWGLYLARSSALGVAVYAFLGAKYTVLWTGNMWGTHSTYYNLLGFVLLFSVTTLVGRSARVRVGDAVAKGDRDE